MWLSVAACGGATGTAPPPGNLPAPAGAPTADPEGDARFQAIVRELAAARGDEVRAWGSAPLAAGEPVRFATLTSTEDGSGDRGVYLLQDRAGAWYRLDFTVDGRSQLWPEADPTATSPAWATRSDATLVVYQAWRGGYDELHVAVQDGGLALAARETLEDGRDVATPELVQHAEGGACAGQCPPVPLDGAVQAVYGPAPDPTAF